jgi:hypothetical protein
LVENIGLVSGSHLGKKCRRKSVTQPMTYTHSG